MPGAPSLMPWMTPSRFTSSWRRDVDSGAVDQGMSIGDIQIEKLLQASYRELNERMMQGFDVDPLASVRRSGQTMVLAALERRQTDERKARVLVVVPAGVCQSFSSGRFNPSARMYKNTMTAWQMRCCVLWARGSK